MKEASLKGLDILLQQYFAYSQNTDRICTRFVRIYHIQISWRCVENSWWDPVGQGSSFKLRQYFSLNG